MNARQGRRATHGFPTFFFGTGLGNQEEGREEEREVFPHFAAQRKELKKACLSGREGDRPKKKTPTNISAPPTSKKSLLVILAATSSSAE